MADLGETAGGVARAGEAETAIAFRYRDIDARSRFQEVTLVAVGRVIDAEDLSGDVAPLDVDGHGRGGWASQQHPVGQAVGHGPPVEDSDLVELQLGRALAEVNIDAVEPDYAWSGDPEQTARIASDVTGVVGVD